MNNLVWQSVTCWPVKRRSFCREESHAQLNRSDRQTLSLPSSESSVDILGKTRAAGDGLPSLGLRPPAVSPSPAPVSSWLSLPSHP